jgi:F-type H+-transporting ATPase subunit b
MTIDWWTIGIQTVNVAILVWLLQRFFWRPVAAMIEQRRDATRQAMADADAAKARAVTMLAEIGQTRDRLAQEREAILAAAHDDAETAGAALLADARRQAVALEATARAAIKQANISATHAWQERSARLAVAIAGQLAARLDGASVRAAFLDWLVQEIVTQTDAVRQAVMTSGATLEVVSATPLDPDEQQHVRDRIGKAFGGGPSMVFRTDPALIAGLELHGPHLQISNSWRADLARVMACLAESNVGLHVAGPGPVFPGGVELQDSDGSHAG